MVAHDKLWSNNFRDARIHGSFLVSSLRPILCSARLRYFAQYNWLLNKRLVRSPSLHYDCTFRTPVNIVYVITLIYSSAPRSESPSSEPGRSILVEEWFWLGNFRWGATAMTGPAGITGMLILLIAIEDISDLRRAFRPNSTWTIINVGMMPYTRSVNKTIRLNFVRTDHRPKDNSFQDELWKKSNIKVSTLKINL